MVGATAAIAGYITGKRYLTEPKHLINDSDINLNTSNRLFSESASQGYSVIFLFINLAAIIASLFLMNQDNPGILLIIPLLYSAFCIIHYRSSLMRFRKVSIWIQFAIITLTASFLWNGIQSNNLFTLSGLIVGMKMISRAIVIIIGFAAISIELKNPVIKSVLYNKGFSGLYQSLNLAFSALGSIISSLPDSKSLLKKSSVSRTNIFLHAEQLLSVFEKENMNRAPVIIVTGRIHQGKTTFLKQITDNLNEKKIKTAGFLSIGTDDNGERTGFHLYDLQTSEIVELCTTASHSDWLKYGKYYFNPKGIQKGVDILNTGNLADRQVVIIDEIGPIEINNKGWSEAVEKICSTAKIPQIWVVRDSLVNKVVKKWNAGDVYIFNISEDNLKDTENKIIDLIKKKDR